MLTSGIAALRATGTTLGTPLYLSNLAGAYVETDEYDDALSCIGEAITTMHRPVIQQRLAETCRAEQLPTWPTDRERRARYIGEWLKTEARYLAS